MNTDNTEVNNTKREYIADKEYVLFSPDKIKLGFIKIVDGVFNLTMDFLDATKFTSTESNRFGVKFFNEQKIVPNKFKICDCKKIKIS